MPIWVYYLLSGLRSHFIIGNYSTYMREPWVLKEACVVHILLEWVGPRILRQALAKEIASSQLVCFPAFSSHPKHPVPVKVFVVMFPKGSMNVSSTQSWLLLAASKLSKPINAVTGFTQMLLSICYWGVLKSSPWTAEPNGRLLILRIFFLLAQNLLGICQSRPISVSKSINHYSWINMKPLDRQVNSTVFLSNR